LTLFAVYSDADENGIALYLVNRTNQPVLIPAQDTDVYAKLEIQHDDGSWHRAQPYQYSWCGNSYWTLQLAPGEFYLWRSVHHREGAEYPIRYSLYNDVRLSSNVAAGRVPMEQIEAAQNDVMAIRSGDIRLIERVLFDDSAATNESDTRNRTGAALSRLAQIPAADSVPILERFLANDSVDQRYWVQAIRVLYDVDPQHWAMFAKPIIAGGASPLRTRLLMVSQWQVKSIPDLEFVELLFQQALDPATPDLSELCGMLASLEAPEYRQRVRQLLTSIQADDRYSESDRKAIRLRGQPSPHALASP
jgi:hypothetical protein